jgi:hypothetical protein
VVTGIATIAQRSVTWEGGGRQRRQGEHIYEQAEYLPLGWLAPRRVDLHNGSQDIAFVPAVFALWVECNCITKVNARQVLTVHGVILYPTCSTSRSGERDGIGRCNDDVDDRSPRSSSFLVDY